MIYATSDKATHFYGTGSADPLREDVTLQSLEAKSARLMYHALQKGCLCLNLSQLPESRLLFPRVSIQQLNEYDDVEVALKLSMDRFDTSKIEQAMRLELGLGYHFESGRYWEHLQDICAKQCLAVDHLWMSGLIGTS
jgi:hypothetical protein